MKKVIQSVLLLALFGLSFTIHAKEDQRVSHVVVVWLNEPGTYRCVINS